MTIREFIFHRGIKSIALARDIKLDPSRLSKFLNGWIELPNPYLERLAHALCLSIDEVKSNSVRIGGRK